MKLRDPGKNPPQLTEAKETKWTDYTMTLITPMYGGGVSAGVPDKEMSGDHPCRQGHHGGVTAGTPDKEMPVRITAIRGQLRYWWRFLAKTRRDKPLSGESLFLAEREIWGGMGEDNKGYESLVKMRVREITFDPNNDLTPCADYIKNKKKPGEYKTLPRYATHIPEYCLFPGRGKLTPDKKNIAINPALVINKLTFHLEFATEDNFFKQHVEPPLRWWLTFGGLGARTRRGAGKIHSSDFAPITVSEATQAGCRLIFPNNYTPGEVVPAWQDAIKLLKDFRQTPGIGRNYGNTPTIPGRSKWPEPDSIRELTVTYSKAEKGTGCKTHKPSHPGRISFPRGAFGLPIVFKFKDDKFCGDPQQTELTPKNYERMASPLILAPYPVITADNVIKYIPAALLMPLQHLDTLDLKLSYSGEDKEEIRDIKREEWWDRSMADKVEPIKKNDGSCALSAFMKFFERGGAES